MKVWHKVAVAVLGFIFVALAIMFVITLVQGDKTATDKNGATGGTGISSVEGRSALSSVG